MAAFIVPIVCEPLAEKLAPASDSHGRVSLQYTLAEAMVRGELGEDLVLSRLAGRSANFATRGCGDLQGRLSLPGPERFKGAVQVIMQDGTVFEAVVGDQTCVDVAAARGAACLFKRRTHIKVRRDA